MRVLYRPVLKVLRSRAGKPARCVYHHSRTARPPAVDYKQFGAGSVRKSRCGRRVGALVELQLNARHARWARTINQPALSKRFRPWETTHEGSTMARKLSKNTVKARAGVEARPYLLADAIPLIQAIKFAKFDENVDLTLRLGVDPRHADQMVRGTVDPAPRPRQDEDGRRHLVRRQDPATLATEAGADFVRRRRARRAYSERRLDGLRRPDRDARHDAFDRPSRQGARPQGPHAESQDRHRDHGRRRGRQARSRPVRSSSAPTRPRSSTSRSARLSFDPQKLIDNAMTVITCGREGQAGSRQGQVRQGHLMLSRPWAPASRSTRPSRTSQARRKAAS